MRRSGQIDQNSGTNVTTEKALERYDTAKSRIKASPELLTNLKKFVDENRELELRAIEESSSPCPLEEIKEYKSSLSEMEVQKLKNMANTKFQNYDVIKAVACTADAIFYSVPGSRKQMKSAIAVKEYIKNLRVIGKGVQGVVVSGGMNGADDLFAIKIPRNIEDADDLLHEYFVGLKATNSLRMEIPNFVFVYGAFYCSPPTIDETTGNVLEFCSKNSSEKVPYVIYENISPSKSFRDYTLPLPPDDMLSLYFEAVMAVIVGYERFKFTHFDLHNANFLVKKLQDDMRVFQIPYQTEKGTIYVSADAIGVIVDYGFSHISYKERSHGIPDAGLIPLSILPNTAWPLHDFYKLACFTLMDALMAKRDDLVTQIMKVIRFFNKEDDAFTIADEQYRTRYAFPYISSTKNLTVYDFLNYILSFPEWSHLISTNRNTELPLLTCQGLSYDLITCDSPGKIRKTLKIADRTTFVDIYDQEITQLPYTMDSEIYKSEKSSFMHRFESAIIEMNMNINSAKSVNLNGMDLVSYQTMLLIQSDNLRGFKMANSIDVVENFLAVGAYVANLFQDEALKYWIRDNANGIKSIRRGMCEIVTLSIANYEKIKKILQTEEYEKAVKKDKRLSWYKTSAMKIKALESRICAETQGMSSVQEMETRSERTSKKRSSMGPPSLLTNSPVRPLIES